jgi:hypothetical protein
MELPLLQLLAQFNQPFLPDTQQILPLLGISPETIQLEIFFRLESYIACLEGTCMESRVSRKLYETLEYGQQVGRQLGFAQVAEDFRDVRTGAALIVPTEQTQFGMAVNPVDAPIDSSGPTLDPEALERNFLSQPAPSCLQVNEFFLEP